MHRTETVRVRVRTKARKESVVQRGTVLEISVQEPPERHAANARIRTLLALHFKVTEKSVRLVQGHHRTHKTYQVIY